MWLYLVLIYILLFFWQHYSVHIFIILVSLEFHYILQAYFSARTFFCSVYISAWTFHILDINP